MDLILNKWEEIILYLKKEYELTEVAFNSWIKPLKPFKIDNDKLYISFDNGDQANNKMAIDIINRKYTLLIKTSIAEITSKEYECCFITAQEANEMSQANNTNFDSNISLKTINQNSNNSKYTFDNFVVGKNNRFAQTAALAVAESPGENYNPLYLYGGSGLGKTHLMKAIGNYILNENPQMKVLYVTSEDFTNEVIESIRSSNNLNAMQKFRDKYRTVDVLMVDDIQFIIGKDSTQEEFFHTFNKLDEMGKQVVISSDKPPKEMEILDERFKSRFDKGLMADIGYPDYETRMAILKKKAEERNFYLSDEIMNYIVDNIKSNVREIEGALNRLIAFSNISKQNITIDIAERELKDFISPTAPREITPQLIIEAVAEHFNLTVDMLTSKNKSNSVAIPRQIAMYLCTTMTDSSQKAIGVLLGGRDHSTIIHGSKKIGEKYNSDDNIKATVDTIKKKINPN